MVRRDRFRFRFRFILPGLTLCAVYLHRNAPDTKRPIRYVIGEENAEPLNAIEERESREIKRGKNESFVERSGLFLGGGLGFIAKSLFLFLFFCFYFIFFSLFWVVVPASVSNACWGEGSWAVLKELIYGNAICIFVCFLFHFYLFSFVCFLNFVLLLVSFGL